MYIRLIWFKLVFFYTKSIIFFENKKDMKNFDKWNEEKKKIDSLKYENFYVNVREIYFTKMWINIGFEQDWKKDFLRPVLIIKRIWILIFCIPLSTKFKDNLFYKKLETCIFYKNKYIKENSMLILSQWKTLDTKRFIKQIWYISKLEFEELKKILKNMYF